MPEPKLNGSVDLLARAMRRVLSEAVDGAIDPMDRIQVRGFAQPNKIRPGKSGVKARAEKLTVGERGEISAKAASER